jgi:hypothetical protein
MKLFVAAFAVLLGAASAGAADYRALDRSYETGIEQFTYSFAAMPLLPRRYQNHCGYFKGHYVCADHCGLDYQVYSCSTLATGCCHVGYGYCDGLGHLHCGPPWF